MPSGDLSDTVTQIAAKSVLKKTLFDKAVAASRCPPILSDTFPLTSSLGEKYPLTYRSAIALKQAALEKLGKSDAATLAKQWVKALTQSDDAAEIASSAIAVPWIVDADAQGWITIAPTDSWISGWLHNLNHCSLGCLTETRDSSSSSASAAIDTVLTDLSKRRLCAQLALSLPMLLQFAHAYCCYWLSERLAVTPSGSDLVLNRSALQLPREIIWSWSSQSPIPCRKLLQAVVYALDTMADQQGNCTTCLRQGYTLAAAVYDFQAAIPLATVQTFSPDIQLSIGSLIKAAQQSLALVILGVLEQTPMQSF